MMKLTKIVYCGAYIIVPVVDGQPLQMPHNHWDWGDDTY